jgi:hypothetical protein
MKPAVVQTWPTIISYIVITKEITNHGSPKVSRLWNKMCLGIMSKALKFKVYVSSQNSNKRYAYWLLPTPSWL